MIRPTMTSKDSARYPILPKYRHFLKIGTCSWKYPSWKGPIYDPDKSYRPDDFLADYAKHLGTVEVDQWFWSLFPGTVRLPDAKTVKAYARSVPDDFVFSVKAPNALTLTHFYAKQPAGAASFAGRPNDHFLSVELLCRFLDNLAPLDKKLGPIMFQFEYLNKQKMPSADAFFERFGAFIDKAPRGFSFALETRNPNYLSPALFKFLEDHKLGFVYLEGYYMPPIGQIFDKFRPATAGFQVIRLHGGDRLEIETETGGVWDKIVAPKPEGLRAAARIVRAGARKKVLTIVNLNNHYEGSAPLSIGRFLKVLSEEPSK